MIKYGELVDYIKRNHVSWNTDLFEVLRGFFEEYYPPQPPTLPHPSRPTSPYAAHQEKLDFSHREFTPPDDGEYSTDDLINLFST